MLTAIRWGSAEVIRAALVQVIQIDAEACGKFYPEIQRLDFLKAETLRWEGSQRYLSIRPRQIFSSDCLNFIMEEEPQDKSVKLPG